MVSWSLSRALSSVWLSRSCARRSSKCVPGYSERMRRNARSTWSCPTTTERARASWRRTARSTSSSRTRRRRTSTPPPPSSVPTRASRSSRASASTETVSPFTVATARAAVAASFVPAREQPTPAAAASAASARTAVDGAARTGRGLLRLRRGRRRGSGDGGRAHGAVAGGHPGHPGHPARRRHRRARLHLDALEHLVVDGDLRLLAQVLQPLVELLRLLLAVQLVRDLRLHLVEGAVHLGLLARVLEDVQRLRRLDDAGRLAGLQLERGRRDLLRVALLELLLGLELEVAREPLRGGVLRVLGDDLREREG